METVVPPSRPRKENGSRPDVTLTGSVAADPEGGAEAETG